MNKYTYNIFLYTEFFNKWRWQGTKFSHFTEKKKRETGNQKVFNSEYYEDEYLKTTFWNFIILEPRKSRK